MSDLVSWLEAQIAEDEREARRLEESTFGTPPRPIPFDPARVLAECEAKRLIIEKHRPDLNSECAVCSERGYGFSFDNEPEREGDDWPCLTLRLLALPYADRPGYDESWRP